MGFIQRAAGQHGVTEQAKGWSDDSVAELQPRAGIRILGDRLRISPPVPATAPALPKPAPAVVLQGGIGQATAAHQRQLGVSSSKQTHIDYLAAVASPSISLSAPQLSRLAVRYHCRGAINLMVATPCWGKLAWHKL